MNENAYPSEKIEAQNHLFSEFHDTYRYSVEAKWSQEVFDAQFGVDGLSGKDLEVRMQKRDEREAFIGNVETILSEVKRRVDEHVQGGNAPLAIDAAFELVNDAISVVKPETERFNGLREHIAQVTKAQESLMDALGKLSETTGETCVLGDHERELCKILAKYHDHMKNASTPLAQYEADHPNLMGYIVETYFEQLGIPKEDVGFLAFVERNHENVYAEAEHLIWVDSDDPKQFASALFLVADTLSESIDFEKLGDQALVLNEEKLLPRLGGIVKRYNDALTSSNIWFEWASYTVQTYIKIFQKLGSTYGVEVPSGLYARLIDSILDEFTKLRVQDDARVLKNEFIQQHKEQYPHLADKMDPIYSSEQKERLIKIISQLEGDKADVTSTETFKTSQELSQRVVSILNTFADPHGAGESLSRDCSHETWRLLKGKHPDEAQWSQQGDADKGNNYANVFVAGNEFYSVLNDESTRQECVSVIAKWIADERLIAEKIVDPTFVLVRNMSLRIAEAIQNGYAFSHGLSETYEQTKIEYQYMSFISALSIANGYMFALSGKKEGFSLQDTDISALRSVKLLMPYTPNENSRKVLIENRRYLQNESAIAKEFATRREHAFQNPKTNPLQIITSSTRSGQRNVPISQFAAKLLHETWLEQRLNSTNLVTFIAPPNPTETEIQLYWSRRQILSDGAIGDARLIPFDDLPRIAMFQCTATIYAAKNWVRHEILERPNTTLDQDIRDIEQLIVFLGKEGGIYDGSNPLVEKGAFSMHVSFIATALQLAGIDSYRVDATRQHQLQVYPRLPSLGDEGVDSSGQDFKKNDRSALLVGLCVTLVALRDSTGDEKVTLSPEVIEVLTKLGFSPVIDAKNGIFQDRAQQIQHTPNGDMRVRLSGEAGLTLFLDDQVKAEGQLNMILRAPFVADYFKTWGVVSSEISTYPVRFEPVSLDIYDAKFLPDGRLFMAYGKVKYFYVNTATGERKSVERFVFFNPDSGTSLVTITDKDTGRRSVILTRGMKDGAGRVLEMEASAGSMDKQQENFKQLALREAKEEIGITDEEIQSATVQDAFGPLFASPGRSTEKIAGFHIDIILSSERIRELKEHIGGVNATEVTQNSIIDLPSIPENVLSLDGDRQYEEEWNALLNSTQDLKTRTLLQYHKSIMDVAYRNAVRNRISI